MLSEMSQRTDTHFRYNVARRSMLANAFIGSKHPPNDEQLAMALGPAKKAWDQVIAEVGSGYGVSAHEWNSYSRKAGWSLRLKQGDRIIVYLSPSKSAFTASFALGEKALAAAYASKLPAGVLKVIREAKKYAEGTAVRLEIHRVSEVAAVCKLAAAKINF